MEPAKFANSTKRPEEDETGGINRCCCCGDDHVEVICKIAGGSQICLGLPASRLSRARPGEELIHKIISHFRHDAAVSLFKFYIKARPGAGGFLMHGSRVSCLPRRIRLNVRYRARSIFHGPLFAPFPEFSTASWKFASPTTFFFITGPAVRAGRRTHRNHLLTIADQPALLLHSLNNEISDPSDSSTLGFLRSPWGVKDSDRLSTDPLLHDHSIPCLIVSIIRVQFLI